jgi:hypothetical protein
VNIVNQNRPKNPISSITKKSKTPTKIRKKSKTTSIQPNSQPLLCYPNPDNVIHAFRAHIPHWGGSIEYQGNQVELVNTCTQDGLEFALWALFKLKPNLFATLPRIPEVDSLLKMISLIEELKWNKAKQEFIVNLMKYNKLAINKKLNFFGREYGSFTKFFAPFQQFKQKQICTDNCENNGVYLNATGHLIELNKINNNIFLDSGWIGVCPACKNQFSIDFVFVLFLKI